MKRFKVEKYYFGDDKVFGDTVSTSFYDTKGDAIHHVFDDAIEIAKEVGNNCREIIIEPADNYAILMAQTGYRLYGWYITDLEASNED